jgi:transposase-like protein
MQVGMPNGECECRVANAGWNAALGGELTHHLGYPAGGDKPHDTTNHCHGTGSKTVLTDDGPLGIINTRGHFPTDEAATKLIRLALRNITAKWARRSIHWKNAMRQFAILYEDRFLARPT